MNSDRKAELKKFNGLSRFKKNFLALKKESELVRADQSSRKSFLILKLPNYLSDLITIEKPKINLQPN
jgi:protein tyrosine/serine phosphatase